MPPSKITLADGIAVARVGALTLPIVSKLVSDIVTVSGDEKDPGRRCRLSCLCGSSLARLKVVVPDKPGSIATLVAEQQSNILQISQNRAVGEVQLEETEVELILETRGQDHVRQITHAITSFGFRAC